MNDKLKVGVVGVGGIASHHFPGWQESPHAELVAMADLNAEVLQQQAEKHGISLTYDKPEDMFNNNDIDIVDICVPNMFHTDLTLAALQAGKHVLCEKPLAPTPQEIEKMIAARDKSGKLLMTAQHMRFEGNSEALKAQIDKGLLGEIYYARCWYLRRAHVPTWGGFLHKKSSGGGPCIDVGVHILDLTLWMMGNPKPVTVSGMTTDRLCKRPDAWSEWGGRIPRDMDVEELAVGFVRFDNGASLTLEVSWKLHHELEQSGGGCQMWLYGDKAGAHWPSNMIVTSDDENMQHMDIQLRLAHKERAHYRECMAFAEAIAKGQPSPVPAEQSLYLIAILDGLYQSAREGREIKLDF